MLTSAAADVRDDRAMTDQNDLMDVMRRFIAAAQDGDTATMRTLMDD